MMADKWKKMKTSVSVIQLIQIQNVFFHCSLYIWQTSTLPDKNVTFSNTH